MAITRISQSSIKEGLEKYNSFYGGLSGLLFGDYDSIQTITVGAGGASAITFSNIPQTYQHLQIRFIGRDTNAVSLTSSFFRFNSDTTWSLYHSHGLRGNGATASAVGFTVSNSYMHDAFAAGSATANVFSAGVIDILDYSSTTKNKVIRYLGGTDLNGSGMIEIGSNLYASTNALTVLRIEGSNYAQHTSYALYGIKAP